MAGDGTPSFRLYQELQVPIAPASPPGAAVGLTAPTAAGADTALVFGSWVTTAAADGSGVATATLVATGNVPLRIDRYVLRSNSVLESHATVYVGPVADDNAQDDTTSGNCAVGDQAQPIYVPAGSQLIVQWTGCTPGAICKVSAQLRRTSA